MIAMASFYFISLLIFINVLTSICSQHNSLNHHKIVLRSKIKSDMYRIKQILDSLRSLFNSRNVYRKHNNMLKTFWMCCPEQRIYLFDIRNTYHVIMGTDDCHNFIRDNRTRLTRQCQNNLKLFDPTRGDVQTCDGRLLRNLADKYVFVVELSNYTER